MDNILLIGADDVVRGGHLMQNAADDMVRAVSQMEDTFSRQRNFFDEWLDRFSSILEENQIKTVGAAKAAPKFTRLHCSNCNPSQWVVFESSMVIVQLNLEKDQKEYTANCPYCGNLIKNSRSIYS